MVGPTFFVVIGGRFGRSGILGRTGIVTAPVAGVFYLNVAAVAQTEDEPIDLTGAEEKAGAEDRGQNGGVYGPLAITHTLTNSTPLKSIIQIE